MEAVNVYPEIKKQVVHGFGGAFTESTAYCYSNLPPEKKEEFLQAYFSKDGLNYNLGRTHINSCDFSLGNYAADEDKNDDRLEKFSLAREQKYILPLITDAEKISPDGILLLLSPWSPPAHMKTNGEMNHGGFFKDEYYSRWAAYMARFVDELKTRGIESAELPFRMSRMLSRHGIPVNIRLNRKVFLSDNILDRNLNPEALKM